MSYRKTTLTGMRKSLAILSVILMPCAVRPQTGTLVILNKSDNTASLVNCASKVTLATIPTGVGPHEVAVAPDGNTAVVSNYGTRNEPERSLTVINIASKARSKDIDLGEYRGPHGITYFADGKRVAVTAERNKSILVVNIETGKIECVIGTDQDVSHMVVLTPDNSRAFVANIGSGSVTAIDTKTSARIETIKTANGAEGIDASPSGKEVWVVNRAANTVSILDARELKVLATIESKDFPIRIKFTPDGAYALVSNASSGEVAVFDTKSRKEVHRIKMELSVVNDVDKRLFGNQFGKSPTPIGILVHPSGKQAYIANSNADLVTVVDLKEWKIIDRIKTGKEPDGLGFSQLVLK